MTPADVCATSGKVRFGSRTQARRHARRRKGGSLDAYECGACGGWHLSSRGRQEARRIKDDADRRKQDAA